MADHSPPMPEASAFSKRGAAASPVPSQTAVSLPSAKVRVGKNMRTKQRLVCIDERMEFVTLAVD